MSIEREKKRLNLVYIQIIGAEYKKLHLKNVISVKTKRCEICNPNKAAIIKKIKRKQKQKYLKKLNNLNQSPGSFLS